MLRTRFSFKISSFQLIILGFAVVILAGALLLMLPFASQSGTVTPFGDTLFTATSAVCVTGLVVRDTASYWSGFGQFLILLLIQIGGLGVITMVSSVALLSGRRISLMQRHTMQEAISAPSMGGIVHLTIFLLKATFLFEFLGMLAMLPVFIRDFGFRGIWMAAFHSVSAFCNAGFDLLGTSAAPFVSLTAYQKDPIINLTIMALIVIGGIGFLTWDDLVSHRLQFHRFRMQTKVILVSSLLLILLPAVFFFFTDFCDLPFGERILSALFQAVTPRTAGFNTADLNAMSESSRAITILLMLIGGSPGSTAGGMKTTTFVVLLVNSFAVFLRRDDTELFGRRIDPAILRSASTIFTMYLGLSFLSAILLAGLESLPFEKCIFETASAIGTVGLTLGITPGLHSLSRLILIFLMFAGRVGGLTLIFAALAGGKRKFSRLPLERITVG